MTFCSFKLSNYCYWHFVINSFWQHVNTASFAYSSFASLVYPGNGDSFVATEKNNNNLVQELYGSLHWPHKGNSTIVQSLFTLRSQTSSCEALKKKKKTHKQLMLHFVCDHSVSTGFQVQSPKPAYKSHRITTSSTRSWRQNSIKQQYVKYLIIISFWFEFFVWEIDPQLARTQPNSCIAFLLPQTLQVSQKPVCVGKHPRFYYYVLLVHSEKCAL